jgi:hypothetical protein
MFYGGTNPPRSTLLGMAQKSQKFKIKRETTMNPRGLTRHPISTLLIACIVFLLLSACQPVPLTATMPRAAATATQTTRPLQVHP